MVTGLGPGTTSRLASPERRARLLLLAILALAVGELSSVSLADEIYLKNGRKIVGAVTREDSKQIFYERAGNEFAIPRSLVERIEKFSSPPPQAAGPANDLSSSPSAHDLQLPLPPAPNPAIEEQSQAVKGDAIDDTYLERLDNDFLRNPSAQNRRVLAQAYQDAAIFLTRRGDPEAAIEKYRHALKFAPDDLAMTLALGYLLVKQNHHPEAINLLLPAVLRNPKVPDIPMLLGSAYYSTERLDQAIAEWKKALAMSDNPRLREALDRVERERNVAGSYLELHSEHFLLRCEERGVRALGEEVLRTLEASFHELQLDLDIYPRDNIVVLLYPNETFRDITRSASWVGALNDGKIRIPVSGLSTMTLELARVLKHELTHSFVQQVTVGRCPVWFNEGLAQLEEGATTAALGNRLARAFHTAPAYSALESSFMELPEDVVGMAYAKSLAAVEYLRETYGLGEIRRLLKSMAGNPNFSSLLQEELRLTYPALEDAVAAYLEKRYGS